MSEGWIGVDLDGTLAEYNGWMGMDHIGEPIPRMKARVEAWLFTGQEVRILTARVCSNQSHSDREIGAAAIWAWTVKHFGRPIPATSEKDFNMIEIWDDRARRVETNTGKLII